ncbi:MAG TPA: nuclear transport factor 2 family protein [Solirubrobacteraceae bacterium]|nr:nuclear transport factor 2 family protein [Solirubrobacteraceae bacterium]
MSSTASAVRGFKAAIERGDIDAAAEHFAPDIVLHSPVTFHPYTGRDTVRRLLHEVAAVFGDFRYVDELAGEGTHALIFRASVGEREVQGMDLLEIDSDGLIAELTVMLRPLSGLVPFAQAMAERAVAAGLETTRA